MKKWIAVAVLLLFSARGASPYLVAVSNERAGTISLVDATSRAVVSTISVGKRPRGIHASADGKQIFVALSGTPIAGPPKLDADSNPIFAKEDPANSDHSADGIGIIDVAQRKLVRTIPAGSDPEQFAVSRDGSKLYISNEDIASMSVVNVADGKVFSTVPVKEEPEGVAIAPDGRIFVTCETRGEVCVLDAVTHRKLGEFVVQGRPRNVAFLRDGSRAFVPSESKGTIHVVNTQTLKTESVIRLPNGSRPMDVAIDPETSRLFVSNGRAGTISVIDTSTAATVKTISIGKRPWGMALAPNGFLYVANGPSNDISVIDVKKNEEVARIRTGDNPWGVAIVPTSTEVSF